MLYVWLVMGPMIAKLWKKQILG